jgi:hypothetical protein
VPGCFDVGGCFLSKDSEPYLEDVESFCCLQRGKVRISVRTRWGVPVGDMITGVPVSCSFEVGCSKSVLCLLDVKQITCRRMRK